MLSLLYAISCENVVVAETGVTSLINILERVEAEGPNNEPKVLVGMGWHHIGFWTRGSEEMGDPVTYEQRTLVITPDGDEVFDVVVPFVVSNDHVNFRNVVRLNGFPVTISGTLRVETHLRKQGDEEWVKHSEFPIITERKIAEVANDNENQLKNADNEVSIKS